MENDSCKILPANTCHKVLAQTSDQSVALAEFGIGADRDRKRARHSPGFLTTFRGLVDTDDYTLARFVALYLNSEIRGVQSPNTLEAKTRDLVGFIVWFVGLNGHGRIEAWMPRDTQAYLHHLEGAGRAATTINRAFATLRRFAKWAHEQPGHVFEQGGVPTRGIRDLDVDEADCKKLTRQEVHQLFKAADTLVCTETRKNSAPRRNRAILAVLYYTGLRVSELVALKREQYQNNYLVNVARKGRARSKGLYVVAACRKLLDEYLTTERRRDDPDGSSEPLFLGRNGGFMTRQLVYLVLQHIEEEAQKHQKGAIGLHPHRLRHTFGAEYRHKTGSDTETAAALGHTGLKHVGRYVRQSRDEREAALEEMFAR